MRMRFMAAALLAGVLFHAPAALADDFIFVRPGDPDRIFKRDEALIIELPPNLSGAELNSLFLELDGVDITQRITLEGTRAVFYPASPHGPGTHALRLVRLGKNGKLVEIDRWSFNVVGGEPPVEAASSVAGTLDGAYSLRVWDNYDQDVPEPDVSNFALQGTIDAAMQQGDWRVSMRGNGFANTDSQFNPSRDPVEVGEYLLQAQNAGPVFATTMNLGSHDIGASNILMDQFYRRGASGMVDYRQGRARVVGFSMNPAPATGNRNFFGLNDGGQLASGVHTLWQPFSAMGENFEVEATAYRGKGTTGGTGASTVDLTANKGDGYQFGFKSQLVPEFLGMRAQYANIDFTDYGLGTLAAEERDEAYDVDFSITPLRTRTDDKGRLIHWELRPGYYQAGSDYQTLVNPSAERDRQIWSLENSLIYGNFTLDGALSYIRDNVNDIDWLPHDRSWQAWLQGSYAPEREMWGRPVFMFGGAFSDDARLSSAAVGAAGWLDRQMWSGNGGVVLSFEKTTWTVNHTYTVQYDDVDTLTEYGMHYTDFGLEYRVNERLTLRPGLQTEFLREDADGPSTAVHGSLGVQAIIIPDKLWNNTSVSALLNEGDTPEGRTYSAETEFNWMLKPAELNSAGYALAFSGLYDNITDTNDVTDAEEEDLRFLVRLKMSMPYSLP